MTAIEKLTAQVYTCLETNFHHADLSINPQHFQPGSEEYEAMDLFWGRNSIDFHISDFDEESTVFAFVDRENVEPLILGYMTASLREGRFNSLAFERALFVHHHGKTLLRTMGFGRLMAELNQGQRQCLALFLQLWQHEMGEEASELTSNAISLLDE